MLVANVLLLFLCESDREKMNLHGGGDSCLDEPIRGTVAVVGLEGRSVALL